MEEYQAEEHYDKEGKKERGNGAESKKLTELSGETRSEMSLARCCISGQTVSLVYLECVLFALQALLAGLCNPFPQGGILLDAVSQETDPGEF